MPAWEDVIALGTRLPGVEVSTSYGKPSLKAAGKGMCTLRVSDPDEILSLRVIDEREKEALLQQDPGVFFTEPHYDGSPYLLVRLAKVAEAELAELIEDVWRLRSPKRLVAAYDAAP